MALVPKISVVLPVFNRESLVALSVASILAQDFEDFELIIVNDGSTDGTLEVLGGFDDPRIRLVTMPTTCGNAIARNLGLNLARGEFIATMDSDDVALPERLGKQWRFLKAHPDVDFLGTNLFKIVSGQSFQQEHAADDAIIKARLLALTGVAMIHPTTMMRAEFLRKHGLRYPMVRTDVDHALWIEAMLRGARFAVLQDYLLCYYRHEGNLTAESGPDHAGHQRRKTPMRARLLGLFFPKLTHDEALAIAQWMEAGREHAIADVCAAITAIRKAAMDTTSYWGESKAEVIGILEAQFRGAVQALQGKRRPA
ncbi:MAG: glycosyltransferase family 2 protein [Novosphingobium sp.]|nr:glycosyltransferase family 2 protein [Novosphingobium sp.]